MIAGVGPMRTGMVARAVGPVRACVGRHVTVPVRTGMLARAVDPVSGSVIMTVAMIGHDSAHAGRSLHDQESQQHSRGQETAQSGFEHESHAGC